MVIKITTNDLEYNNDFQKRRAKELNLYEIILNLPEGLEVQGFSGNRVLIHKVE